MARTLRSLVSAALPQAATSGAARPLRARCEAMSDYTIEAETVTVCRQHFSWRAIAARTLAFYERLLRG